MRRSLALCARIGLHVVTLVMFAIVAFLVMPSFRQFAGSKSLRDHQELPATVLVLMSGLALSAASRIPTLAMWDAAGRPANRTRRGS